MSGEQRKMSAEVAISWRSVVHRKYSTCMEDGTGLMYPSLRFYFDNFVRCDPSAGIKK